MGDGCVPVRRYYPVFLRIGAEVEIVRRRDVRQRIVTARGDLHQIIRGGNGHLHRVGRVLRAERAYHLARVRVQIVIRIGFAVLEPVLYESGRHGVAVRFYRALFIRTDRRRSILRERSETEKRARAGCGVIAAVVVQRCHGQLNYALGQLCPDRSEQRAAVVRFKRMDDAVFILCRISVTAYVAYRGEVERGNVHELRRFDVPERPYALYSVTHRRFGRAAFFERLPCKFFSVKHFFHKPVSFSLNYPNFSFAAGALSVKQKRCVQ